MSRLLNSRLDMVCTFQAPAAGVNALGEPDGAWADVPGLVNVPCHLVEERETIWRVEAVDRLVITTRRLIVPAGTAVLKSYRVNPVTLPSGTDLGPFLIEEILERQVPGRGAHHVTVILKEAT